MWNQPSILNLPVIQMKSFYEVETPFRDIFVMHKIGKFDKYFVLFGCSNLDESKKNDAIQCALTGDCTVKIEFINDFTSLCDLQVEQQHKLHNAWR